MCGIAGFVGPNAPRTAEVIRKMTSLMAYRGPDGEGLELAEFACFGHRRLSIIDLTQAGHQPIRGKAGNSLLTYNGEVYNYKELRSEFLSSYNFKSQSDTEVLLAMLDVKGEEAIDYLRGMFAFAYYDHFSGQTILVRDRFGIKPLFYLQDNSGVWFASEIKALLPLVDNLKPNMHILSEYLQQGIYDHREDTFFGGIKSLQPGCLLRVGSNGVSSEQVRYYDIGVGVLSRREELSGNSERQNSELLSAAIEESVSIHSRSDVAHGVNLSGGIDSSALLAFAEKVIGNNYLNAFSMDYEDDLYSERDWVHAVVDGHKVGCHFSYTNADDCFNALDHVLWHQDEPYGGVPTISWYSLFQHAKNSNVTVLLDGDGVDDFMCGYEPTALRAFGAMHGTSPNKSLAYQFGAFWNIKPQDFSSKLLSAMAGQGRLKARDFSSPVFLEGVQSAALPEVCPLERNWSSVDPITDELIEGLQLLKVPRTQRFKDRNSMAFSREVRVPFLDHILVEIGLALPLQHKVHNGMGKYLLRQCLEGMIGNNVRLAPKRTVQTPQREWLRTGAFAKAIEETLEQPTDLLAEVLDIGKCKAAFRKYCASGAANANPYWQWLILDRWYQQRVSTAQTYEGLRNSTPSWSGLASRTSFLQG